MILSYSMTLLGLENAPFWAYIHRLIFGSIFYKFGLEIVLFLYKKVLLGLHQENFDFFVYMHRFCF